MSKHLVSAIFALSVLSLPVLSAHAGLDVGMAAAGTVSNSTQDYASGQGDGMSWTDYSSAHRSTSARNEFRQIDSDHDGYLSAAELSAADAPAAGSTTNR